MDDSQLLINKALGDKYEIKDLMQSGGMGKIYLGVHKALGRKVAIKIIHQELVKNEEFKMRFYREAKLAAGLDHPGIIDIYDFGSNDDFDYIIMPFIDGETFQQRIKSQGPFETSEAVELMIKISEALYYAHQHNVYHRDIKPSNIMLDHEGRVIIADFGISKEIGDSDLTAPNTVLGSPRFMSPEQIKGESVDARSDLYSLGLVFYEMLAGTHPFQGKDTTAIYYAQAHEIPARPETVVSDIPRPLGNIIMRLLEKTPEKRYADGGELLKDLHDYQSGKISAAEDLDDATIVDSPSPPPDGDATIVGGGVGQAAARPAAVSPVQSGAAKSRFETKKFIQTHKKKMAIGAAVLLTLLLVIVLFSGKSSKKKDDSVTKGKPSPVSTPVAPPAEPTGVAMPEGSPENQEPSPAGGEQLIPDMLLEQLLAVGNGKEADNFDVRTDEHLYHIGQAMRFLFETKESCYVLILTFTTDDELIQVFPNYYHSSQFVQADREYEIPDERMGFDLKVTGPAGTETVIALVSDKPFDLLGSSFSQSNPFLLLNASDSSKISDILGKLKNIQHTGIYSKTITYEIE